ncbi:MAG: hypothetical protein IKB51_05335 [Clostridia bacterium]|nr:hypothetical protein [Clostridia bacterium]
MKKKFYCANCKHENCTYCKNGICFKNDLSLPTAILDSFLDMKEYTLKRIEKYGKEAVLLEEEQLRYATVTEEFYDIVYELIYVNEAIDDPDIIDAMIAMNPYLDMCPKNSRIIDSKLKELEVAWWQSKTPPSESFDDYDLENFENEFNNYDLNIII